MALQARVVTVSDSVANGTGTDGSGPALADRLREMGYSVACSLVPDGVESVSEVLSRLTDGFCGLVVTTGGTGFGSRDLTPEGTARVVERLAPGIAEAVRSSSPFGPLSRGIAGIRGTSLIVNLPGSPKAVVECLDAIGYLLPHALALLAGSEAQHPTASHQNPRIDSAGAAEEPHTGRLTHVDARGQARMVDVSAKQPSRRVARAACRVLLSSTLAACLADGLDEVDVLGEARIAGIGASKLTPQLIPLCHPIGLSAISMDIVASGHEVTISATTETVERTGVEMEALTACAVGALVIAGACRSTDQYPIIEDLTLWEKSGGRSGHWSRSPSE